VSYLLNVVTRLCAAVTYAYSDVTCACVLVIFRYTECTKFELNDETKETHDVIVIVTKCMYACM